MSNTTLVCTIDEKVFKRFVLHPPLDITTSRYTAMHVEYVDVELDEGIVITIEGHDLREDGSVSSVPLTYVVEYVIDEDGKLKELLPARRASLPIVKDVLEVLHVAA